MSEEQALAKAARLAQMQNLLYRSPRGLSTGELAERCRVTVRTVQRDLHALETMGVPLWQEGSRYGVAQGYFLPPVKLSLSEATALFLAARLLWRCSDEHNPCVAASLAKLSAVLPERIAAHVQATLCTPAAKAGNPSFPSVFEAITTAWASQRRVRIWHQSGRSQNVHEYVVEPYFIEPSAPGYAAYLIGYASYFNRVQTFKIERIQRAELLPETFKLPEGFDVQRYLSSAWGIMWGDEEIQVRLRFSHRVARRVKESLWHASQEIVDLEDGGCEFSVRVSNTLEMIPWIRGWGADCEVLAPPELRAAVAEEMRRAAQAYETANGQV